MCSKGEVKLLPVAGAVVLPGAVDDWKGGVAAGVCAKREKLGLVSCACVCRGVPWMTEAASSNVRAPPRRMGVVEAKS